MVMVLTEMNQNKLQWCQMKWLEMLKLEA